MYYLPIYLGSLMEQLKLICLLPMSLLLLATRSQEKHGATSH